MTLLTARPIPIQKPVARERLKVFVHLVEGFGARRWSEASTKGQIAGIIDRLPYGYYRASDETCAVEYSEDREESVLTRFLRLAIRRLIGFDILHAWRNRRGIFDADVVWTHTELEHLAVLLLWQVVPRGCRPKLIAQSVWLFDRWEGFSPLKRWLYRKLLAQADLLTVLSPENLKIAQRIFPGNRTEFIRFGIDHGRLTPALARKSRAKARILALGRDMHRDWATLIEAAGDWEQCELRIGAKKISHRLTRGVRNVTLVQPTTASEVRDLYRWADLVVLSLKPNFHASGITVLAEAALSGVPVVCTDTGGLRAYFSGEEVRYVPPENAAEMRAAIKELAADHHLRHQFARKAQARLLKDNITSHSYALRHRDLSMELAKARYECREMVDRGQSMFASSQPMRVFVFLGHGFGASWARGELPGINERLPYGYYHASDSGCTVKYSRDAGEGRLTRILRLGMRRVLGFDMLHAWRNRNDLFDTDVVWTHTELEHLAVLALWQFIPRRRRPKIIAQCVWLLDKWGRLGAPKRWLYTKLLAQADVVTAQSPESLKAVRRLLPDVRSQMTLYGIDADAMVPAVQRHVHKPLRILSLGRDMHRDWATLIDAVGGWEECEVRIGAKSIARRLARRSRNIRLVAPDSRELRELYAWADMIVIPLKPNLHVSGITVVAEAVLFGVPMVCTDTGGLRAYFSDDEVRYVPANDPGAMRCAIEQLAANDALRFEMTSKAQERLLKTELSTRARARRLSDLSRDLLRAPPIGKDAEGQSENAYINV